MTIWNEKFSSEEYLYGKEPNEFLKEELEKRKPAKIIFLGEGEGRNAAYAAKLGWKVTAVDASEEGMKKAIRLANENNVAINYLIDDVFKFKTNEKFDAVVMIFLHVHDDLKEALHKKAISLLNTNGEIILEAFEKDQLNYSSGGPKNIDLLYDLQTIAEDFIDLDFIKLSKEEIDLNEGIGHKGKAVVFRFIGKKTS